MQVLFAKMYPELQLPQWSCCVRLSAATRVPLPQEPAYDGWTPNALISPFPHVPCPLCVSSMRHAELFPLRPYNVQAVGEKAFTDAAPSLRSILYACTVWGREKSYCSQPVLTPLFEQ